MSSRSLWFVFPASSDPRRARLFCFPYAGGGSAPFQAWGPLLADVAVVAAARPPGRESRFREPAIDDAVQIARSATESLEPLLRAEPTRPYSLFGHSLGGTVAFEVARELRRRGLPRPEALIVSGRNAPTMPSTRKPIAHLPDKEFIEEIAALEGTPKEVLANAELLELCLPMLRTDFHAAEAYRRPDGEALDLPIFAYGGTSDDEVSVESLQAWQKETSGPFKLRLFEGGHFFIHAQSDAVLAAVREDLRSIGREPA